MDKRTLKTINSVVSGAETAIRFLPIEMQHNTKLKGAFGAIASITGIVALGQALLKKDAFDKDNRINTAIIVCLSAASILQGVKKVKQAYAIETGEYDLMEEPLSNS